MSERRFHVLFLCTGNSARSIVAETLLNAMGEGRFQAYSAGSHPVGRVNRHVADVLVSAGFDVGGARSKSWDEFAQPGAPPIDLAITVCDDAAGEACPVFPGAPAKAHWPAPDPAAHADPETARGVARDVLEGMRQRIAQLVALPVENLDRASLQARVRAIGERTSTPAPR